MGAKESKQPEPEPWRLQSASFEAKHSKLMDGLRAERDKLLNIMLIGHSGAGKSTLINSIFSISRGRIVDKTTTKADNLKGVGTYHYTELKTQSQDNFKRIRFCDTMGYTNTRNDALGITHEELVALFDGRVEVGHKFVIDKDKVLKKGVEENRPHCVVFVVGAQELLDLEPDDNKYRTIRELYTILPTDIARIAIITKIDQVCEETNRNIEYIYTSERVHGLVKKAQAVLGVQENHVFPIVNFVTDMEVDNIKSVPILMALKFAFDFAEDRREERQ